MSMPGSSRTDGFALAIVGIVACETGATLLIAIGRAPVAGLAFVAGGIAIAFTGLRRYRRNADAIAGARIEAAKTLLADGSHTAAWNAACAAAYVAAGEQRVRAAVAVMARIALDEKDYKLARNILEQAAARRLVDPWLEAEIERGDGHPERAIEVLEGARERAALDEVAARMLVELHAETNNLARAVRVAIDHVNVMKEQDLRNMIASLQAWGHPEHAVALTLALALRRAIAAGDIRRSGSSDRLATR
jgi:hypothetical protein